MEEVKTHWKPTRTAQPAQHLRELSVPWRARSRCTPWISSWWAPTRTPQPAQHLGALLRAALPVHPDGELPHALPNLLRTLASSQYLGELLRAEIPEYPHGELPHALPNPLSTLASSLAPYFLNILMVSSHTHCPTRLAPWRAPSRCTPSTSLWWAPIRTAQPLSTLAFVPHSMCILWWWASCRPPSTRPGYPMAVGALSSP